MSRADKPPASVPASPGLEAFPHATVFEVNERCLELLVHQARGEAIPSFPIVTTLREVLRQMTPETRKRAAARAFLLLDLEFQNAEWWETTHRYPQRQIHVVTWRGAFPRRSGLPLARATLLLAWQGCRADKDTACVLFGMARPVAGLIAGLQLTEIDGIADRRFRHLHPRWHDRPDLWRSLLTTSESPNPAALRRTELQALQLVAGDLIPSREATGHGRMNSP
jgi:hypothetical protein